MREKLPHGIGFEWTELTLQEILEGNTSMFIFPLCVLFVFLTLAALYESWSLPLAIILIVPMCLLFAISGRLGRAAWTIIFSRRSALSCWSAWPARTPFSLSNSPSRNRTPAWCRADAAVEASRLRLRPILMTSFAFIFGVVPLVLAEGAGGEMRRALGTAVFSGMLGVTFFGIFLTPVFYVVIRRLTERKRA